MKISNEMREFLKKDDIKAAIQKYDFEYIYYHIPFLVGTSKFTELMLDLGCNPLDYIDFVPTHYLTELNITQFIIPNHIKYIQGGAFAHCNKLETITIPTSIEHIGQSILYDCKNLKTIYYDGTREDWRNIEIQRPNRELMISNITFKK